MANYPLSPGARLAYDLDGTSMGWASETNPGGWLSAAQMRALNDENSAGGVVLNHMYNEPSNGDQIAWIFAFPEPRVLRGLFISPYWTSTRGGTSGTESYWNTAHNATWSPDTTNGRDGTWYSWDSGVLCGQQGLSQAIKPFYRRQQGPGYGGPDNESLTGIYVPAAPTGAARGLQLLGLKPLGADGTTKIGLYGIHLYGDVTATHTTKFWHPTLDQEVSGSYFDFEEVEVDSLIDRPFRVKNASPTLTAQGVDLSIEELTISNPNQRYQFFFAEDGLPDADYRRVWDVGTLAPGAISPVINLRRITPRTAQLSVWTTRLVADVQLWY